MLAATASPIASRRVVIAVLAVIALLVSLPIIVVIGVIDNGSNWDLPSSTAESTVNEHYLLADERAGADYGVPWQVLAAIQSVATNVGSTSPYDSPPIVRGQSTGTSTWPEVRPPIGDADAGQGLGPFLLSPAAVAAASRKFAGLDPQNVTESTNYVAELMSREVLRLSHAADSDPAAVIDAPVQANPTFWAQVVQNLPIFDGAACAPPPGLSGAVAVAETFACAMSSNAVAILGSGGLPLTGQQAVDTLVADAEQVAWSFSQDGTAPCDESSPSAQGELPLPATFANRCDPSIDLVDAAQLVIKAIGQSRNPWVYLPLALGPDTAAVPSYPDAPWSPPSACRQRLDELIGGLDSGGSGFAPTTGSLSAAAAAWDGGSFQLLGSEPACRDSIYPKGPPSSIWEGVVASEVLARSGGSLGEQARLLVAILEPQSSLPTRVVGSTSLVTRFSSTPLSSFAPQCESSSIGCTLPLVQSSDAAAFPQQVVDDAITFTNGGVLTDMTPPALTTTDGAGGQGGLPMQYGAIFASAAQTCPGLPWQILAAIADHESSFEADPVHDNAARGIMQMYPATFAEYDYPDATDPSTTPVPPGASPLPQSTYTEEPWKSAFADEEATGDPIPQNLEPPDVLNVVNQAYAATRDLCSIAGGSVSGGLNTDNQGLLTLLSRYHCGATTGCSDAAALAESELAYAVSLSDSSSSATDPAGSVATLTSTTVGSVELAQAARELLGSPSSLTSSQFVAALGADVGLSLPSTEGTQYNYLPVLGAGVTPAAGDLAVSASGDSGVVIDDSSVVTISSAGPSSGTVVREAPADLGAGLRYVSSVPASLSITLTSIPTAGLGAGSAGTPGNAPPPGPGQELDVPSGTTFAASAAQFVAAAETQLGVPYVYGGLVPKGQAGAGLDCSGLVVIAARMSGVNLLPTYRTTYYQYLLGTTVPLDQLQPGNLLFFQGSDGTAADPGHVAIYLGDNEMIQAYESGTTVEISPLGTLSDDGALYSQILLARNLFTEP